MEKDVDTRNLEIDLDMINTDTFRSHWNALQVVLHETALQKGWHNPSKTFGEQIVMMHSELSEVIEEYRKSDGTPTRIYHSHPLKIDLDGNIIGDASKPEGVPIEFADLLIRVFDTAEYYGIDLFDAIFTKARYNLTRSQRHGDKKL